MTSSCPACSSAVEPDDRFCRACGSTLSDQRPRLSEAERRHLSVMFCDLVGSTSLSSHTDPEDLRELILAYQDTVASCVRHHGGYVANYIGDGILAYFGYPQSRDDDARRAVVAGLDIIERVAALDHPELATRVAVHTGEAVVGQMGTGEAHAADEIVGLTPNLAARLQDHAEPNSLIISETTADLVEGFFELRPMGSFTLKGITDPVTAYEPTVSLGERSRYDISVARGLSPLIGRSTEIDLLHDVWQRTRPGVSASIIVRGDPGVGKTRLVREFLGALDGDGRHVIELRCSAMHAKTPLYPVVQHLLGRLGPSVDGAPPTIESLERMVEHAGLDPEPTVALLAGVMRIDGAAPADLPEGLELRRAMALDVLRRFLLTDEEGPPLVVVVEDLHWADPTTSELLGQLVDDPGDRALMLLATARLELVEASVGSGEVEIHDLSPLDRQGSDDLIRALADHRQLPDEIVDRLVERSDGVPLFIEEFTRGIADDRSDDGDLAEIPTSLHDLLVGLIDRQAEAKTLLQAASVIGREFDPRLLTAIGVDFDPTQALLDTGLVLPEDGPTGGRYSFRHGLIRDAAYSTLLRRQRVEMHAQIATSVLDANRTGVSSPDLPLDVLAHHCEQGELYVDAITSYQTAAAMSMASGSNGEAIALADRGLSLIASVPEGPERDALELGSLAARGPALMAEFGFAHEEVERTFRQASALCDSLGDPPEIFPVLYGLIGFYLARAELDVARGLAGRILDQGQAISNEGIVMLGHAARAQVNVFAGAYEEARRDAASCAAHHNPDEQAEFRLVFGEDPGTVCRGVESWILGWTGRWTEALDVAAKAIELARSLDHEFTLAQTLLVTAQTYHSAGDAQRLREVTLEGLEIAETHGFPMFIAQAAIWTGWLEAAAGDPAGPPKIREGLEAFRAGGAEVFATAHLVLLAEALVEIGDLAGAAAALDEAFEVERETGCYGHAAAARLLEARILARQDAAPEVWLEVLDDAETTAMSQGASYLALRAATLRLELVEAAELHYLVPAAEAALSEARTAVSSEV